MQKAFIAALTLLLGGTVYAVIPSLNQAQVSEATKAGEAMSVSDGGYVLGNYLLVQYTADVILRPDSPEVDGIVVSTPYEHLRYEAYLAHLEQKPLTSAQASDFAAKAAGKLTFRIYTHSPYAVDEEDEQWQMAYKTDKIQVNPDRPKSYLDFFKTATLTVSGKKYTATPVIDGPYMDNFTLPSGKATFRNLGVVFYTFNVGNLPASGPFTLSFKDTSGKAYNISSDLSKHR